MTKTYVKEKIRMLKKEFCIPVTSEEKEHFYSLKNEIQVDNYVKTLIMKKLWKWYSEILNERK